MQRTGATSIRRHHILRLRSARVAQNALPGTVACVRKKRKRGQRGGGLTEGNNIIVYTMLVPMPRCPLSYISIHSRAAPSHATLHRCPFGQCQTLCCVIYERLLCCLFSSFISLSLSLSVCLSLCVSVCLSVSLSARIRTVTWRGRRVRS